MAQELTSPGGASVNDAGGGGPVPKWALDWGTSGPLVLPGLVPRDLCDAYVDAYRARQPRPRSYQGTIDLTLRDCAYVALDAALDGDPRDELMGRVLPQHIGADVRPVRDQPTMVYRYGVGPGFVPHHDEVTEVEVLRARTNGQPVLHGDITIVYLLSPPSSYGGGSLRFFDPDNDVTTAQGTVVAFPAWRNVRHAVSEITRGERFSVLFRADVVPRAVPTAPSGDS